MGHLDILYMQKQIKYEFSGVDSYSWLEFKTYMLFLPLFLENLSHYENNDSLVYLKLRYKYYTM